MEVIQCKDIVKNFNTIGKENAVLKGINLNVMKGDFVSIVGPSGSGKSTLLYILGGLDKPTEGKVVINDNDLYELKDRELSKVRRDNIGFIYQFYNLMPNLTVMENILVPVLIRKEKPSKYKNKVQELLEKVGLKGKENSKPSELSGGQQQRVAIVRALINDSNIILADEPIGNLDSKSGKEIMELLKEINREYHKTIIQVTHSMDATKYGTRLITLKDGIIEQDERIIEDESTLQPENKKQDLAVENNGIKK